MLQPPIEQVTMESKPQIIVATDARAAAKAAASEFVQSVRDVLNSNTTATVALSGGSTPRRMHRLLAQPPYKTAIDWGRVDLFWVDERLVPYSDAASNFGAACEDLIDPLQLDSSQVHPVPVAGRPAALARDYETALKRHFNPTGALMPAFDLLCLGAGTDGHTASLFPHDPALTEKRRWAIAVKGGNPAVDRITLSLPVINTARQVLFLVTGPTKSDVVKNVMTKLDAGLPAQRVRPKSGNLIWLLDRQAASGIQSEAAALRETIKI